jgi:hypothetical protein
MDGRSYSQIGRAVVSCFTILIGLVAGLAVALVGSIVWGLLT